MFGRKSLEEKLRAANGKSAPATILSTKEGAGYNPGNAGHTRQHYTLRVEPVGEPSFEAKVTIWGDELPENPQPGRTVVALYDPDDHSKVAFDLAATIKKVQEQVELDWEREDREDRQGSAASTQDPLEKLKELGDLRDRGVLTQAEFEAEKAKLLNR
jgi:hypothetical protein